MTSKEGQISRSAPEVHLQTLLRCFAEDQSNCAGYGSNYRILVQILLVIYSARKDFPTEAVQQQAWLGFLFLRPINRFDLRKLGLLPYNRSPSGTGCLDHCLFVYEERRIDHHEIVIPANRSENYSRVIVDPHCLSMPAAVTDVLIGRSFVRSVCANLLLFGLRRQTDQRTSAFPRKQPQR